MGFQRNTSVQKSNTMEYENLAEGEHEARLVWVADLGNQKREYLDLKPPAQQLALGFEVLGSTVKVDGVEQPRTIWSKPFNIFNRMSGLSTEYAYYKSFVPTAQEETVADWEAVLGKPVNIIIKHFKKDANTYDNVDSLVAIPQKYQTNVPEAINTDFSIAGCEDADSPAIKNLFGLAKFVHEKRITDLDSYLVELEAKIKAKEAAEEKAKEAANKGTASKEAHAMAEAIAEVEAFEDDIPF